MKTFGTAGHVDHGKSTLIRALTGINPDRLAEEKAREMTIDLGFAWWPLANGETLGFIDVPGHRDFVGNMLAGAGGIDAALLVIAADEGPMPQTREHLHILELLGIHSGLIILTKIDRVDDPDWLTLVETDIQALVLGTALQSAPIVRVSAQSGEGLLGLKSALQRLAEHVPNRPDIGLPRLPIDRVFTQTGFGTVVTGTLTDGIMQLGDEVEVQPQGQRARIRGIQTYQKAVPLALPGSRTAINLSGLDRTEIRRGCVLTKPGAMTPTQRLDVRFQHLADLTAPLKHNTSVQCYIGTAEVMGRIRLIGTEQLDPGAIGWIQIELDQPVIAANGDRIILRRPSPSATLGGGQIVNTHPHSRYRRFRPEVISQLEARLHASPAQRLAQAANGTEPVKRAQLQQNAQIPLEAFEAALTAALAQNLLTEFPGSTYLSSERVHAYRTQLLHELTYFHAQYPLKLSMSRELLRSCIGLKQAAFAHLLALQSDIVVTQDSIRLASHAIRFSPEQQDAIRQLMLQFEAAPFAPPALAEAVQAVGQEVLDALITIGDLVQVAPGVIFSKAAYKIMVDQVLRWIEQEGSVSTSAVRDGFATSRKYAIGLLEHLDRLGITQRDGEVRIRAERPAN